MGQNESCLTANGVTNVNFDIPGPLPLPSLKGNADTRFICNETDGVIKCTSTFEGKSDNCIPFLPCPSFSGNMEITDVKIRRNK